MKKFTVSVVRERLAEALDAAHQGVPVIIERRGVRYRLTREARRKTTRTPRRAPIFAAVDPAVLDGGWSWTWTPGGADLVVPKKPAR
jgi:antitoxin (DNA-binding transcriptional repressor) of toxin-antitoxin stability system